MQPKEEAESIKDILITNPIFLKDNNRVNKVANLLLPYSTGFEIECNQSVNFNSKNFETIPNILDVNCDFCEQRFRIPEGLNGFKCLFNIIETLKTNSIPNENSGIHYHIDFTDVYDNINNDFIKENSKYILEELDKWNYKGSYNKRFVTIGSGAVWVRFQDVFKSMEIRIGEMTFDYEVMINRILHCQEIAFNLKIKIKTRKNTKLPMNINEIINNRTIII